VIALGIAVYLGGWGLITTALVAARSLAGGRHVPRLQSFAMTSMIAGAIWPLLLVGVAELGSVMTYAKLHRA